MEKVCGAKLRSQIPEKYKWKIEKVYKNDSDWECDFKLLTEISPKLKDYSGDMGNPHELLNFLKEFEKINRLSEKLYIYAYLKSDEDTANPTYIVMRNKIAAYNAEIKSFVSFFYPEILALDVERLEIEFNKVPELKMYKFYFADIMLKKEHTLTKEKEQLLASVSELMESPANIYKTFVNADITFPVIRDENGKNIELTEVSYGEYIRSKDRKVRENAFKALFGTYRKYRNTLSETLTSSIKNFVFDSKTRNYKSSLESSLKPNNIPLSVYDNLINTVNENIDLLHRYVVLKKKLLKLDEIHMYDLYVSVIDVDNEHIEYEDAVEIVKKALAPLGKEYIDIFSEGINKGWVDVFENKNKKGGAYSWGSFDTMPYVLLNYNYTTNDVSTLAHEMGHSIHSYYSRKNQPYIYSGYTLFCAEVASTTNECLLINYLIENEKDKRKKQYYINQELENIRTTVFRQTMFAEFEKITHDKIEGGLPLTAEDYCKIWHELNVKYFGPDMVIDDEIDMEWARIPHFYRDFYVYQYATGYSAANSFANSILKGGESEVDKYKGFLKSGGSNYSTEILKIAGTDLTSPKPIQDTMDRFKNLLNMLE